MISFIECIIHKYYESSLETKVPISLSIFLDETQKPVDLIPISVSFEGEKMKERILYGYTAPILFIQYQKPKMLRE